MAQIEIEWLNDEHKCETCGWSYASGAIVKIDGKAGIFMVPVASCLYPVSYEATDVYTAIITHLGHTLIDRFSDDHIQPDTK